MPARSIDIVVAACVAAAYFAAAFIYLPREAFGHAVARGIVVLSAVAISARLLRSMKLPAIVYLAVAFVAAAALWVPTFPAMGGTGAVSSSIAFLGVQAATLLWAALTWQAPPQKQRMSLRTVLGHGLLAAVGLSVIASVPIALSLLGNGFNPELLLAYPAYFAGLLAAAVVYWLLQSLQHLASGRYLIGTLGGFCVYLAAAPIVYMLKNAPLQPREMIMIAFIIGSIVGPVVSLSTSSERAA